ncbi:hypothetical protein ABID49_001343 [Bhargavaea ullalensis]|uniref:Uncharacterized protein n=1 Tax=Bhargavaea ullalensis TaxID=1265685 RepID=A0ABV2GAZ6_9BACL
MEILQKAQKIRMAHNSILKQKGPSKLKNGALPDPAVIGYARFTNQGRR